VTPHPITRVAPAPDLHEIQPASCPVEERREPFLRPLEAKLRFLPHAIRAFVTPGGGLSQADGIPAMASADVPGGSLFLRFRQYVLPESKQGTEQNCVTLPV